jgi:hypothetical protein
MRKLAILLSALSVLLLAGKATPTWAQTCPCNIWSASTVPANIDSGDATPGEYGVRFQASGAGYIAGIRFYKSQANTGTHIGNLWSNTGTLLATVTFTNETATGWQQATFDSPVAVTAGTTYVASYYAPVGHYSFSPNFFSTDVTNAPLVALADGADGANGIYAYYGTTTFPTSTWDSNNYWVDVVYNQTDLPSIVAYTPASGATSVSISSSITATFSEAMSSASINSSTFELLDQSSNQIAATVVYNATSRTATLQPTAQLSYATSYSAIVRGGTAGSSVTNLAGNVLPANVTWSFTTPSSVSSSVCPCTIWPSTAVPTVIDSGDGSAGEYGVRFQSSQSGYITGIRFYKSQANTGTHTGNLWSNAGTLLASATFIGETSSGWQQVNFTSPIQVTAGTTYVASYFTPTGHYSFTSKGFGASVVNAPLTALADGADGSNGVYSYSTATEFPTSTYGSSNYWVDVVYSSVDAPNVVAYTPVNGAVSVATATQATVTFDEAISPATVNGSSFQLLDPSGSVVGASVTYASATNTAVLTPTSGLASSTTYTAIVSGGSSSSAVQNLQGNALPSNFTWSFTTGTSSTSAACPCTIWSGTSSPTVADSGDTSGTEVGVKFTSDIGGYITGIRFFKSALNTGKHIGNLWSSAGSLLATATFTSESSSGWQEISFGTPVAISQGVTYVASYYAPSGHYAFDQNTFVSAGLDTPPLHALSSSSSGGDGVYAYGTASLFPAKSFNAANYWVDVVFVPTNTTAAPTVVAISPSIGSTNISPEASISVSFSEAMDSSTMNASAITLTDPSGNAAAGTVTYSTNSATLVFQPTYSLLPLSTYTATVNGAVKDYFGNQMGSSYSWTFTTQGAASDIGPGGPILVISSVTNPYARYLGEILLAEGLNEYTTKDISAVTSSTLSGYDLVILGDMALTSQQASMLSSWVSSGGNLIAMHPDQQLSGILGLTSVSQTLSNAYLSVNTAAAPGTGIVALPIQFHGPADLYTLNGATSIATLYSSATSSTSYPAVVWNTVGQGKAAAFTYDLARSVVYTRQGNPAWSGEQRDPYIDPTQSSQVAVIRPDDLYYGNASFDPEPDWVNLSNVQIPQADEQQRLLANLVEQMNTAKKPLPRFWYFPSGYKAVVVMTGDDHNNGGTSGRFDQYVAYSPSGCVVEDWTCVRSTSNVWPNTAIPNYLNYVAEGFEITEHHDNIPTCTNFTPSGLAQAFATQNGLMATNLPGLPASKTNRNHCLLWSDYDTTPNLELTNGIRLDTSYYYWPDSWVQDRPGLFTGSGLPMRFADRYGSTIDVYQVATQFPDETTWTYPKDIDTVLDNALGANGYYAAITANMHTDGVYSNGSNNIVYEAQARSVPIVSQLQMLTWLDGRNASTFSPITWDGTTLSFTVTPGTGARHLFAMIPATFGSRTLSSISLSGTSSPFGTQTIKGIQYAIFESPSGVYQATYGAAGYFVISGTVAGAKFSATSLTLSGAASTTVQPDSAGNYTFAGLPNGSYTVTANAPGSVWSPASQSVTISGSSAAGVSFSASGVTLQSMSVTPSEVIGGTGTATLTVTLDGPAPLSGVSVALGSDQSAAVVPSNVAIPAYASTASITITTSAVSATTIANIVSSYSDSNLGTTLQIDPPGVQSVSLSPASVIAGGTSIGTVTLSGAAGSAGVVVQLSTGNASVATVPSTVTVPSGATTANFTVTSLGVSSVTTVAITAASNTTASAILTVNPPTLTGISISPQSIVGGNTATGTVTLSGVAPSSGISVALQNSSSSVSVPSSVAVPSGSSSATFTLSSSGVSSSTAVTVTATLNGSSRNASITIVPASVQSLSLSPTTVTGGTSSTGSITLNGKAPPGGFVVSLRSSQTSAAQVPGSVTVGAGATIANFTVTTSAVASNTSSTITASGIVSATLTINAPTVKSLTLAPTTVIGGTSSTGTITLSGPAPSGGFAVALSSTRASAAQVPSSATVAAGATTATFTVTTSPVTANTSPTISASGTVTALLTVDAPTLSALTLSPTTVRGGFANSTGTVTLSGPAPTGGSSVSLSSNNTSAATVPASVTVAARATTATFTVTSHTVTSTTSVTITGSYGALKTATLSVTR